jgi:acyl carrier protein
MSRQEVATRVENTFGSVFGGKLPFSPRLQRADTALWTSLKHMEFLMALESEFGVRFDGADAVDMQSIPSVVERVTERLA